MNIRTILVAVADPTAPVQPAVTRAGQLALAFGAHLVLFHAGFNAALSGRPFFDSKRLAKSRGWFVAERTRLLEKRAAELRRSGVEAEVAVVWEEPPHEAIVRAVLRAQADLVVAGRHERRQDQAPQLRWTDWELMRLCPRPLLLTGSAAQPRSARAVLAALDPSHANDKPANLDEAIARHAVALAHALELDCHAAHFIAAAGPRGAAPGTMRQGGRQIAAARMKRVLKKADAPHATLHVLRGSAAEGLPALARKLAAQILVMGLISRRWLDRLLIGDTAERIIREVPCDILLIKPASFRLRLGRSRKQPMVLPKKKS
jgi:universal stress protein E